VFLSIGPDPALGGKGRYIIMQNKAAVVSEYFDAVYSTFTNTVKNKGMTINPDFENAIQTMEREAAATRSIACIEFQKATRQDNALRCGLADGGSCLNYPECKGG